MRHETPSTPTAPGVVFDVSAVEPARDALTEAAYKDAVESLLQGPTPWEGPKSTPRGFRPVEACTRYHGRLVANVEFHPVVAAVHFAFQDHRPLTLSPDVVWLLIAQGFANHVNANAERLRPKLVAHASRATITVRRDDFVKGSPENPWAEVFAAFTDQIRGHVGEATHDLLLPTFSTTGPVERAAAQVVLMDAVRSYFQYEFVSLCGIPQVELLGTPADWADVARRFRQLAAFDLGWWVDALGPILDEFTAAAEGRVNTAFWQSIYKREDGSGGPYTTGWITAFFPYLKHHQTGLATERNEALTWPADERRPVLYPPPGATKGFPRGYTTEAFPSGLARAPFVWKYLDQSFDMEFLGGFVGVRQDADTLRLTPEIGWAVRPAAPAVE